MILCAHSNVGFLNETDSHSHARAHIFLSENKPFPHFNGAVLSIAQIIKFVMASAAKSELAALFVMVREMIPHRQTLISIVDAEGCSDMLMSSKSMQGKREGALSYPNLLVI
jgi:hypothetical protein